MPSHMVLNPEPNLRPLSIRREVNPLPDHHPGTYPPQAGHTSSSSTRNTCLRDLFLTPLLATLMAILHIRSQNQPLQGDCRPKKKQRSTVTTTESSGPPPSLPVIRDIPPGGFNF